MKSRALLLACSNLILQLMGFVYRMALTRLAGAEALGLNSLVMQVYGIVVSVCISGLSVAATALAAPLRTKGAVRRLFKKCLAAYCALWSLAALPIFILRRGIAAKALGCPNAHAALSLMLACIFMTGLENVLKAVHMGRGLVSRCAASELTEQGVRFLLVIVMLAELPHADNARTVFLIMLGMTCSEFVSVGILGLSFAKSFCWKRDNLREDAPEPDFARISAIALPAIATAASANAFSSACALLLPGRLMAYGLSRSEALSRIGVFNSAALPVMLFPMAAVSALASVLMPRVAACKNTEDAGDTVSRSLHTAALFGAASTACLAAAGTFLTTRLFGTKVESGMFALLGAWAELIYLQAVCTAALNGAKRQRSVLIFAVSGESFRLILMLLLTPALGMYGFAAASLAGELIRLALSLNEVKAVFSLGLRRAFPPRALSRPRL